ncbi:MAG: hypothetical protein NWP47_02470 [Rickettsiaceae bacterium]|nr:hypothetical protein [Rickettsiaceae bacterium]
MINKVLPVNTNILSDKRIQEHIRNLKAVYSDKAKAEKAYIWINNFKVKFGKDLDHTVKNINKTSAITKVKAELRVGRLILFTTDDKLKIHDPQKILKNIVDKGNVGINEKHTIQIIRKGIGNSRFIYTFNDKKQAYRLDQDFSKSNTIYLSGKPSVYLPNPVVGIENLYVIQEDIQNEPPNEVQYENISQAVPQVQVPAFELGVAQVFDPEEIKIAKLQENLALGSSIGTAVLVPAVKFEMAKIFSQQALQEIEPEIDYRARAIELLDNKNKVETRRILTETAQEGNFKLMEAMMKIIGRPPENVRIFVPSYVDMQRVYNDSLVYSRKEYQRELSDDIKKTCGLIASQAKVLDHETKIFHNLNGGYYSKAALHILL